MTTRGNRLLYRGYSFGRSNEQEMLVPSKTTVPLHEDETTASNTSEENDDSLADDDDETTILWQEAQHVIARPNHAAILRSMQLVMGALGIYAAFISYGVAQEKLYSHQSPDGTIFRSVWFLQVVESSSSIVLGLVGRRLCGSAPGLKIQPFLYTGASQVLAKASLSLSLVAGVSFPIVTLAKSAKMVPVMAGQYLLAGSPLVYRDIVFALFLVSGTVLLSFGTKRPQADGKATTAVGIAFVLLSLVMDGCTGGLQQKLKRDTAAHPPTTFDYIFFSHLSMVLVALVVSILTGDLGEGFRCLLDNRDILGMVAWLCLLSVVGQVVIFYVISTFDPLVCATITTTRKMCSVLLSIGTSRRETR